MTYRVLGFDTLGSTNDEAMHRLKAGDPGGLVVTAARQTGGRGRHGRSWASPPGNLYASLALRDPSAAAVAAQLGFVAGVALAATLRARVSESDRVRLKWPNDLVVDGAKLAGILLESALLPDGALACVIGFGVNCVSHPEGLAYPATDLRAIGDRDPSPVEVLEALAVELERRLGIWRRGAGFASIRASWLETAAGLGGEVAVVTARRTISGTFRDIDMQGRLVVETGGACVEVAAGDVFLTGPAAGAMQDQDSTRECD